jgi:tripartite-type tricarboxylate transporter receptor subunit TctC
MKLLRRQFLCLAAGAAVLPVVPGAAQTYPTRPVRIIVPYPPGGGTDVTARLIGQWLADHLGQPFVVENRAGAGTNLGTEVAVKAAADGYTLLVFDPAATTNATLYENLNFNFIRDIAPIAPFTHGPFLLAVNSGFPAKTVPEFIAYTKANPGKVNMATPGNGTLNHLSGELLNVMAGLKIQQVHYRGAAPAVSDLLGGQVQAMIPSVAVSIEHIRAGRLRALAVTTRSRLDQLPEVPPLSDFVPGYETMNWYGLGAPKGIPAEFVSKLNREVNAALGDAAMDLRLTDLGGTPFHGSAAEFAQFIANETEKWRTVIRSANIKAE